MKIGLGNVSGFLEKFLFQNRVQLTDGFVVKIFHQRRVHAIQHNLEADGSFVDTAFEALQGEYLNWPGQAEHVRLESSKAHHARVLGVGDAIDRLFIHDADVLHADILGVGGEQFIHWIYDRLFDYEANRRLNQADLLSPFRRLGGLRQQTPGQQFAIRINFSGDHVLRQHMFAEPGREADSGG